MQRIEVTWRIQRRLPRPGWEKKNISFYKNISVTKIFRLTLAQKYGYTLTSDQLEDSGEVKDPRQVFFGLEPGWIVSLADQCIYKPDDTELETVYKH